MTDQPTYRILDRLIEQDACFAIFRLPHETSPRFVLQTSDTPTILRDFDDLNGERGFVIAPFRISAATPALVIRPDRTVLPESDRTTLPKTDRTALPKTARQENTDCKRRRSDDKSDYSRLFNRFHQPLAAGEMEKLVLSRSKTIDREATFSPGDSFFNAMEKYPHSYVYLFHTPQSGTWLGSTPEILLEGKGNQWHSVSLAGTRYPNSGPVTWDDKNLREQHLVTSYLLKQLSAFHITPEISGPYTAKAGHLAHLRSDLHFCLPDTAKPTAILKALHPTPAVSGLPKDEAYQFIRNNEGHDRLYYSGFLGMFDPEGETNIYVNLRCMHIEKKSLSLFAGSGLLTSSSLDDEWEETEHKLAVMLNIVG